MTPQTISSHKRLLRRITNHVEKVLTNFENEKLEEISITSGKEEITPNFVQQSLHQLEEAVGVLEKLTVKLEQVWHEFIAILEQLPDVEEDLQTYSDTAEDTLLKAIEYTTSLHARINAFKAHAERCNTSYRIPQLKGGTEALSDNVTVKNLELPSIPIRTFSGDIWEWENFWELFQLNIHSQNISDIQKFNFLQNSLKGEPLRGIKRFQLSRSGYQKAIEFLLKRYGNPELLIRRLLEKLDNATIKSSAIQEQRALLDDIHAIMDQLTEKSEDVHTQCMYLKVLSKFPYSTQRRVYDKKNNSPDIPFDMHQLLKYLDDIITNEELITCQTIIHDNNGKQWRPQQSTALCMYCNGNHKPFYCNKYITPQERYQYLRGNNLCHICASPTHSTTQCRGSSCYICQRRHNTSSCFFSAQQEDPASSQSKVARFNKVVKNNKTKEKEHRIHCSNSEVGQRRQEEPWKQDTNTSTATVSQLKQTKVESTNISDSRGKKLRNAFVPVGQMTILNPNTKKLYKIPILLDTGADMSFIDEGLAEDLQLPIMEKVKLQLSTFGSNEVHEHVSKEVSLDAWDSDGNQVWNIIKKDKPHIELPSGLHVLPTVFGNLITGKLQGAVQQDNKTINILSQVQHNDDQETAHTDRFNEELDKWEQLWTLESTVNTVRCHDLQESDDESSQWGKFWTLETKFSNPEKVLSVIQKEDIPVSKANKQVAEEEINRNTSCKVTPVFKTPSPSDKTPLEEQLPKSTALMAANTHPFDHELSEKQHTNDAMPSATESIFNAKLRAGKRSTRKRRSGKTSWQEVLRKRPTRPLKGFCHKVAHIRNVKIRKVLKKETINKASKGRKAKEPNNYRKRKWETVRKATMPFERHKIEESIIRIY